MKKQVLYIHGGMVFPSSEDFRSYLEKKTATLDDLRPHSDWKAGLQDALGDNFDVLTVKMPNKQNASYTEWRIWFSKILPLLSDDAILIGHSLGGLFLVKYLSEQSITKKIGSLLLVAAPFAGSKDEPLADFNFSGSFPEISRHVGSVHIFASEDDPVVPFADAEKYQKMLPTAVLHRLSGYGHFRGERFPELVSLIKSIS